MSQSQSAPANAGGVTDVLERHRIDEDKLLQYLQDTVVGFEGPLTVKQFAGGQSNPTYKLVTPKREYVLRRKPPGSLLPSAHAVDREFRVISAVHSKGYLVPEPVAFCEDESILGTMFYVMGYVEGRVMYDRSLVGIPKGQRTEVVNSFLETMAQLHKLDLETLDLDNFGRSGNYFARQISRWSKQYLASHPQDNKDMQRLMAWLPENIPNSDINCLVHGDFSLHNVMIAPDSGNLVAVLDWELSTTGHPFGDLFYGLMPWYSPAEAFANMTDTELRDYGVLTEKQAIDRYCQLADLPPISDKDIAFYKAYNLFRIAAILQGIVGRAIDGTAADPTAMERAEAIPALAKSGITFVQDMGA